MQKVTKVDSLPEMPNFEKWKSANSSIFYSLSDYIFGVISSKALPIDIFAAYFEVIWPSVIVINDELFFASQIDIIELQYLNPLKHSYAYPRRHMPPYRLDMRIATNLNQCRYLLDYFGGILSAKLSCLFPDGQYEVVPSISDNSLEFRPNWKSQNSTP